MKSIIDPRNGDVEDDGSSTKRRTLLSLAGSLLSEISLPKLLAAWAVLIVVPAITLGAGPLLVSIWLGTVSAKTAALYTGLLAPTLLIALLLLAWFGGKPLWRLIETNFWSLNALAVQPAYALAREALRQTAELFIPADTDQAKRGRVRAFSAAAAGLLICVVSLLLFTLVWPQTRWTGSASDLASPITLMRSALFNSVAIITAYLAAAGLIWALADSLMEQPRDAPMAPSASGKRQWRVVHLSDIHTVGERYGFRIEGGRSGPRGNQRLAQLLAELDNIDAQRPLDAIIITGDITDAGRSAEWAEFLDALARYPRLAELMTLLPGNHDINVVDRANPARLDLPLSPKKRLREMRALCAIASIQGGRVHIAQASEEKLGPTLEQALAPWSERIAEFADTGTLFESWHLADLWPQSFPMVLPPSKPDGLGIILLDSNAETHFSFTNALGLVTTEQTRSTEKTMALFPDAYWIVALHHHVVEYPKASKALSERIGTALINGSWFVRRMQRYSRKIIVMHGHRHIDWLGRCGDLQIVSAPSPVMDVTDEKDTYFYVHNLGLDAHGRLTLYAPEKIVLRGTVSPEPDRPSVATLRGDRRSTGSMDTPRTTTAEL